MNYKDKLPDFEWAHELAHSYGFEDVKFNFTDEGVTFSANINFENVLNDHFTGLSSRIRRVFNTSLEYSCDGYNKKFPTTNHVDCWLTSYSPECNFYLKQLLRHMENAYMTVCKTVFSKLKTKAN